MSRDAGGGGTGKTTDGVLATEAGVRGAGSSRVLLGLMPAASLVGINITLDGSSLSRGGNWYSLVTDSASLTADSLRSMRDRL